MEGEAEGRASGSERAPRSSTTKAKRHTSIAHWLTSRSVDKNSGMNPLYPKGDKETQSRGEILCMELYVIPKLVNSLGEVKY